MSSTLSKALIVTITCVFILTPLLNFLGVASEGITYIDVYDDEYGYCIVGDNFGLYDDELSKKLIQKHAISFDEWTNAWESGKQLARTYLDSSYMIALQMGVPNKSLDSTQGNRIYTPDTKIVISDLALGEARVNEYLINFKIPISELCESEEEWESLSNISKLLKIYSHKNYIPPGSDDNNDSDQTWWEWLVDNGRYVGGGLLSWLLG